MWIPKKKGEGKEVEKWWRNGDIRLGEGGKSRVTEEELSK